MKILAVAQIREADQFTIRHEPISSIELMERAAGSCFEYLKDNLPINKSIHVFCGPGNNGGDGLVIARLLASHGFLVKVSIVELGGKYSEDFKKSLQALKAASDVDVCYVKDGNLAQDIQEEVIIDSIFGSGLSKPIKGNLASLIQKLNEANALRIAIDIPSGLFADEGNTEGAIFQAHHTLSLEFPKRSMMFPENGIYVGNLVILPIGLHPEYVQNIQVDDVLTDEILLQPLLQDRAKFSHKGTFGHALLIAGGKGKVGSAILASKAALRSGLGLLTLNSLQENQISVHSSQPEVMTFSEGNVEEIKALPKTMAYDAIAVGPGIGKALATQNMIKLLIQSVKQPLIFDADALNILSENKTWLSFIPTASILTPHLKEFERLFGTFNSHHERIEKMKEVSRKYSIYIILKGAHSTLTSPAGKVFFNNTGNPGMATAGSGDVLTGILLGLMAQGYDSLSSCLLGMYIHGLAGDLALKQESEESLIASDIINNLGKAFQYLRNYNL